MHGSALGDQRPTMADVWAGLTTSMMLVPQAMAYALLAGLSPVQGLYAACLPLVAFVLARGTPILAVGPAATVSLMVGAALVSASPGDAAALAVAVGALQLFLRMVRAGRLVDKLPPSVLRGYTSAVALIIAGSQIPTGLGVSVARTGTWADRWSAIENAHAPTIVLTVVSLTLIVVLKRRYPRFPRLLLVLVVGLLAGKVGFGARLVGSVPSGIANLTVVALDDVHLWIAALPIAVVGLIESGSIARAFEASSPQGRSPHDSIALGIANIVAGFVGGYPVTAGFSRTAVHVQAGAKSGAASLVAAAMVAVVSAFFTPAFAFLPRCVLAAIILSAVVGLVEVRFAIHLAKTSRVEFAKMAAVFLVTLFVGIEAGLGLGVVVTLVRELSEARGLRCQTTPRVS